MNNKLLMGTVSMIASTAAVAAGLGDQAQFTLNELIMVGGGCAVVGILLGMGFYFFMRKGTKQQYAVNDSKVELSDDDGEKKSMSWRDTFGDFYKKNPILSSPAPNYDYSDALAEAEVYIENAKWEDAIQVLKVGIQKDPERLELHVKLLEIYHARREREKFNKLYDKFQLKLQPNTDQKLVNRVEWLKLAFKE